VPRVTRHIDTSPTADFIRFHAEGGIRNADASGAGRTSRTNGAATSTVVIVRGSVDTDTKAQLLSGNSGFRAAIIARSRLVGCSECAEAARVGGEVVPAPLGTLTVSLALDGSGKREQNEDNKLSHVAVVDG